MAVEVKIPFFRFGGLLYPEALGDLVDYRRTNIPEVSDEDPAEPMSQIDSAFALVMHNCGVFLDLVANESYLPTSRTRDAVLKHLALIDQRLAQATPARVDLLIRLSKVFTNSVNLIPVGSLFATKPIEGENILFEVLEDVFITRTDVALAVAYDASADSYSDVTAGSAVWGSTPQAGDILYIGHPEIQFDTVVLEIAVGSTNLVEGVWEYYDGDYEDAEPDDVTDNGGNITFTLNGWLGDSDRSGTQVRVRHNSTGGFEDLVVAWDGTDNTVTTLGLLGQSTVSEDAGDYTVGSLWQELPDIVDSSDNLSVSGDKEVAFTIPQSVTAKWTKGDVGAEGVETTANWLRFRVISVTGTPTSPTIDSVDITEGNQYVVVEAVQGRSVTDDPLGSSSGIANQRFQLSQHPVLDDETLQIDIDEGDGFAAWTRVRNFLNSTASDTHFQVEFDSSGRATVITGNGVNGKIPLAGIDNVLSRYRVITEADGNVAPNSVAINRAGVSYLDNITNPRSGRGYAAAEGSTAESLARVKLTGPASLRSGGRGVTANDIETIVQTDFTFDGSKPVARALAIEEGLGLKTVKLVVVGVGGVGVSQEILDEIGVFFNGDDETAGKLLLNTELTAVNFTPHPIDVTLTVTGGSEAAVRTALTSLLSPVAVQDDGVTPVWGFGDNVPLSRIIATVMRTTPTPTNVSIALPVADVVLDDEELPTVGTLTITVV